MNVRTFALIAAAVWAPLVTGADGASKPARKGDPALVPARPLIPARPPSGGAHLKLPKKPLKLGCMSKQAVFEKLKARGYNYLKLEEITGPYNTGKGKVYKVNTLVKAGRWCRVNVTVNCVTAALIEYDTIEESCIY